MTRSNLKYRWEEFKRTFESGAAPYNATPETVVTMHRATAELKASGIGDRALKIGDYAPDFTLLNQNHVEVSAKDLLRKGSDGCEFLPGTLVTLLQYRAGGSTRN